MLFSSLPVFWGNARMWSCPSAMSPARQTYWGGPRRALFTSHHTGYSLYCTEHILHVITSIVLLIGRLVIFIFTFCHSPPSHYVPFLYHGHSCCLCPVTLRTAWVRPCSPTIWWRDAALSSRCLQPTTLKGQYQLSLVVSGLLFLLHFHFYVFLMLVSHPCSKIQQISGAVWQHFTCHLC